MKRSVQSIKPEYRLNIAAAKHGGEILARCEYARSMNSALSELRFCEALLKLIPAGSVIILGNASWHRKKVLKALAAAAGRRVIFPPPYLPDFNPIEQARANLKAFTRNYMRSFASLTFAILHFFEVGQI
jgi:transposase